MEFALEERVYNTITGEQGKIIRIMDPGKYVVMVVPDSSRGPSEPKEALWKNSEITREPENLHPALRKK